ncbi:MAG TPA: RNase adapter RapZ [Desulfohalobiaceae bacterium]|nr:RNase adapter RapZ [Desulfohalobiaceae bacterium]
MGDHLQNGYFPFFILTGLSGSGKSTALDVFEDLGFFCVDGLPASMVTRLVNFFKSENPRNYRGLALGIDIRQFDFLQDWHQTQRGLIQEGLFPQIIFLEANFEALIRRYATTRRPHPLESQNLGLEQALEVERDRLMTLRDEAEFIVDTSDFSIHDLRRHLQDKLFFLNKTLQGLRIHILSFGYKYGVPGEADLVFDLRFLPNPFFDPDLQQKTGQDSEVIDYILGKEPGLSFQQKLIDFLLYTLPLYAQEGRYRLTITFGCTGGRHRSVSVAEKVFKLLQDKYYQVTLEHRHLELG